MVIQTAAGPSVAHKFNDWLSIGAGVAWGVLIAEQELKISVPFHNNQVGFQSNPDNGELEVDIGDPTPNEDPINDVGFKFAASDWQGWSWNAAVMIEPPDEKWAWALMVQPPVQSMLQRYHGCRFFWTTSCTPRGSRVTNHSFQKARDKDVTACSDATHSKDWLCRTAY